MRPQPVPCNVTGLALSGGGIRSAAVCLGALQALFHHHRLKSLDYLSTVSGGGYIGCCLSAAMSKSPKEFPFGDDVFDNDTIAHLRNYSNYLLPRGRSSVRNLSEAAVLILRGLLANLIIVSTVIIAAALITRGLYPSRPMLDQGGVAVRLISALTAPFGLGLPAQSPFFATSLALALLGYILIYWAMSRSAFPNETSDTKGVLLASARLALIATAVLAFLDLQPLAVAEFYRLPDAFKILGADHWNWVDRIGTGLVAFATAVSTFASTIGHFLKKSERATNYTTLLLRILAKAAVVLAAAILPVAIWIVYLALTSRLIEPAPDAQSQILLARMLIAVACGVGLSMAFSANGYSLHRFYRDRLSRAFLFKADGTSSEPKWIDEIKLSELQEGFGPYHIINAALNVQGSAEANRRGRNADFFIFTPHFLGSDLTFYAENKKLGHVAVKDMEAVDTQLNLGTALAISGAAVSANMGSNTVRLLSPTLSLLNIRLGYWLKNPRFLAQKLAWHALLTGVVNRLWGKLYLLLEMLNLLDEKKSILYLTDGGHIENLGIYELLKRGCETIVVVDAEADPELAFPSLLKLERYARIDLGVRIVLPWANISRLANVAAYNIAKGLPCASGGQHCAVGRIFYANGTKGILVYFKSSVTGDEKDYILDYKRRNPDFPHETTGDQFFSEEQFEMYRALGYHIVDGFFSGEHHFSYVQGDDGFKDRAEAFNAVQMSIPVCP